MACGSLWLQVVVVVVVVVIAFAVAVFLPQVADKILADTEGWHGRVIGLRTGSPDTPLPRGRLGHMGNWLLCCFIFFFFSMPAAHWWVLVAICLFLSFSPPLSCSSQLRWNWKFVGLKLEMLLLNILYTRLLSIWKKAEATWEIRPAVKMMMSKGNIFTAKFSASKCESSV